MFFTLRKLAMENQYEWQAVIGAGIFAFSWFGLSYLRRYLNKVERKKVKSKILKAYQKLGDDGGTDFS